MQVILTGEDKTLISLCPDTSEFRAYLFSRERRRGRIAMARELEELYVNYDESGNLQMEHEQVTLAHLEQPRHAIFRGNHQALRDYKINVCGMLGVLFQPVPNSVMYRSPTPFAQETVDAMGYKITRVLQKPINLNILESHLLDRSWRVPVLRSLSAN